MRKSGLTLAEIQSWGGIEVFKQAMESAGKGKVLAVAYDADTRTISGEFYTHASGFVMPVSFKLKENGGVESHCPCYQNQVLGRICEHVVALGIGQYVLEMD